MAPRLVSFGLIWAPVRVLEDPNLHPNRDSRVGDGHPRPLPAALSSWLELPQKTLLGLLGHAPLTPGTPEGGSGTESGRTREGTGVPSLVRAGYREFNK